MSEMYNHRPQSLLILGLLSFVIWRQPTGASAHPLDEAKEIAEVERLGGAVFQREGRVVEVNFNKAKIGDEATRLLAGFTAMTDISLEETLGGRPGPASHSQA